jgi:hypothetical protein
VENKKFWKSIHRGILFINGTLLGVAFFFTIRTGLTLGTLFTQKEYQEYGIPHTGHTMHTAHYTQITSYIQYTVDTVEVYFFTFREPW